MYRYKRGVKVEYNRQGYIYFASKLYKQMEKEDKERIRKLCREAGGEHWKALLEFVTTDASATAITMQHYISKATLYRAVKRYYENFPDKI